MSAMKYIILLLALVLCSCVWANNSTRTSAVEPLEDPLMVHNSIVKWINHLEQRGCTWRHYDLMVTEDIEYIHNYCDLGGRRYHAWKIGGRYTNHMMTNVPAF